MLTIQIHPFNSQIDGFASTGTTFLKIVEVQD